MDSLLARVGALPVLLRAILGAQKAGATRIVVIVEPAWHRRACRKNWGVRGRLPGNVEWCAAAAGEIAPVLRDIAGRGEPVVLIAADRTYQPSLHRRCGRMERDESFGVDHRQSAGGDLRLQYVPRHIELLKRCPREHGERAEVQAVAHCGRWNRL